MFVDQSVVEAYKEMQEACLKEIEDWLLEMKNDLQEPNIDYCEDDCLAIKLKELEELKKRIIE